MSIEFVIFAPPYNENSGGVIVLHQLCHLLNYLGHNASIFPCSTTRQGFPVYALYDNSNVMKGIGNEHAFLKAVYQDPAIFATNSTYKTPLCSVPLSELSTRDDIVVIYPENTFGNPLGVKNITRWLLHNPGFHSKQVFYTEGEVQFRYNEDYKALNVPYLETSNLILNIHFRLDGFNTYSDINKSYRSKNKAGSAYIVKKAITHGVTRFDYHPSDAILLDELSRPQVLEVFKQIEYLFSYDTENFYSQLAAVYGVKSIIVPMEGKSYKDIRPNLADRSGVAYGIENIDLGLNSVDQLVDLLEGKEKVSIENASKFAHFWIERLAN